MSGCVESALGPKFRAGQARRILEKGADRRNATQLITARRPQTSNLQLLTNHGDYGKSPPPLNDHCVSKLDSETCRFLPDCTVAADASIDAACFKHVLTVELT